MMKQLEELTLLLAFLTSWDENPKKKLGNEPVMRAWKGYDWDVLNKLEEQGLISQTKSAKSLYLTKEGIQKAKELKEKFGA